MMYTATIPIYLSIYLSLPRRTLLLGSRILGRPNTLNSKSLTRYITGAFGASRINITSFEASSTASDSVFGAGDLLTVTFSEPTNQVRSDNRRMLHSYWMLQGAHFTYQILRCGQKTAGQTLPDRNARS